MLLNLFSLLLLILNDCNVRITIQLVPAGSSLSSASSASEISICPLKCRCQEETHTMECRNMSRADIKLLFASGGFNQAIATLQNLSIIDSELDRIDELPRMEQLLVLNLSGNQLERVEMQSAASLEAALRPYFPSLVILDVSHNLITSISRNAFLAFPNVEEIHLSHNRIFSIDWEAFRLFRLKRLFIRDNYLLTISEHILRYSPAIEELDLSRNQLAIAQSSSFFAAQRLKSLNLSHNRLQRFDYDSFSPLFQLESLDLSYNNFSAIPPDLRQFVALRALNFSANSIEKLAEGELAQPMLQTFDLSDCPQLHLVEQRAFAMTPNLQYLRMANNPELRFISPAAFQRNNSLLFDMDISNNSLVSLSARLMEQPSRVHLAQNPLECGCIAGWLPNYAEKLVEIDRIGCQIEEKNGKRIPSRGTMSLEKLSTQGTSIPLKTLLKTSGLPTGALRCSSQPILPLGSSLTGQVGEFFSLYCAPRGDNSDGEAGTKTMLVEWTLPNGTVLGGQKNGEEVHGSVNLDKQLLPPTAAPAATPNLPPVQGRVVVIPHGVFSPVLGTAATSSLSGANGGGFSKQLPIHRQRPDATGSDQLHHRRHQKASAIIDDNSLAVATHQQPRVHAIGEQLRFELLIARDAGEYHCRVNGTVSKLRLNVTRPHISLQPIEIGSHYVALYWNGSLKIRATERVQFSLQILDTHSGQIGRAIQLSLHNPWHSYNVVRLRPLTNYTFCLVYSLKQSGGVLYPSTFDSAAEILYKTCVDVMTAEQLSFWSSLSPTAIGIMFAICFTMFSLFCFRAIYLRFYIWHEAKMRARMNQSMSGQSFLSHSSSLPSNQLANNGLLSHSGTFDSAAGQQMLNKQMSSTKGTTKNGGNAGKMMRKKQKRKSSNNLKKFFLFERRDQKERVVEVGEEEEQKKHAEDIALC